MRHLFIINPAAGDRDHTAEYRQAIEASCGEKGLDYRIEVSTGPGNCREIACQAAKTGEELRIYACGGDGTLNEVVAGVAGFSNVAVTHFAGGSGNDFIKIFSDTAPFRNLERLLDCEEAEFDLIRCGSDWCLNICSVGLDARVSADMAVYKRLPLLGGSRAYIASAVVNVIKGVSEHYVVEVDGKRMDEKFALICACNGRFYGGGFSPVPDADPTDGLLDVLLVADVSRLKVLQVIGKYKKGKYADYPDLIRHIRTSRLRILCDGLTGINIDGETRFSQQIDIRVAKEKIRFFYPAGLTWQAKAPAAVG